MTIQRPARAAHELIGPRHMWYGMRSGRAVHGSAAWRQLGRKTFETVL